MEIRVLRRPERERLLAFLDRWDVGDGWRGRDFFRRYLEDDPTFREENVWVAAEGEQLASCVQIFPRELRVAGAAIPMGGIGSVFTAPEWRRRGLGQLLLERASAAMAERGMVVSMLFPAPDRQDWYRRLGWDTWKRSRLWLSDGPAPADRAVEPFDRTRDLSAIQRIHRAYTGALDGTETRSGELWEASLRNAGNPEERFLVARSSGRAVVAYARAVVLGGLPHVMEWGRDEGAEAALAAVVAEAAGERALLPDFAHEPGLAETLRARGFSLRRVEDPLTMLRCLDAPALARQLGMSVSDAEAPNDFLRQLLPAHRLHYWLADRF